MITCGDRLKGVKSEFQKRNDRKVSNNISIDNSGGGVNRVCDKLLSGMIKMPDHLSVSQIKMFHRCPMQYEFSYIKGIKQPPAGVMILGSAYHDTVASDLQYKKDTGMLLDTKDIPDIFSDSFDKQVNKGTIETNDNTIEFDVIDWGKTSQGESKDVGIKLAMMYHNDWAPDINPLLVEEYQTISILGVNFVLITDLVTKDKIVDHKVIARRFSESDLRNDIQVTAYTYAHRKPFEFHQALKLKVPCIEPTYGEFTERSEKDWNFFEEMVVRTNNAIQSGIFYPNINGWHCSENYCGYWDICRGRK